MLIKFRVSNIVYKDTKKKLPKSMVVYVEKKGFLSPDATDKAVLAEVESMTNAKVASCDYSC